MAFSFKEIKELERSRKARDVQGLFVTEGKKLFLEAPRESLVAVVATREFAAENPELLRDIPHGVEVVADVREERFAGLCDTKTPQGILAVIRKPAFLLEDYLGYPKAPLFLFLEDLQDPGNAGTILRTAEAAGVDAVFCTRNTVDYYHPKTIRSTMGSIYRVPQFVVDNVPAFFERLHLANVRSFAAHLRGKKSYDEEDYRGGTIFLIGNEGNGLSGAVANAADRLIRIPMAGKVESLNAAMAAGILMYEAGRQRRT